MKLVMITTYATPRNMRRELLEFIRARGHEVTVVAPGDEAEMSSALASFGARFRRWDVQRTRIAPSSDLRAARDLYSILREERPDVVFLYQIKAVLLGPVTARLARVPRVVVLVNGLGSVFDEEGYGATWQARIARRAYALSLRGVDTIVFQNPDDPEHLRSRSLLPADAHWTVVPGSGVDLSRFAPRSTAPEIPTFTLISRLLVSKGIRDFAEAARRLRGEQAARFRIVGQLEDPNHPDAVTRDELEQWVRDGLVEYRSFTDDIPAVLTDTTVFVLPSYYREGVPRTNLEALAMGLPVVTCDSVGCRETVVDGVNGFLVPPRDPATLAERLRRYVRQESLVAEHGRASRALAEQVFAMQTINAQMLTALGLERDASVPSGGEGAPSKPAGSAARSSDR
ncbi:MAG: glycosyltransferase family 4 protein [Kofleriaceae bacterium]|nr:glycosyltransferase family 4 protein [Kofleriaceae bacterium]